MIRVTFESHDSRGLYKQIADFVEAGAAVTTAPPAKTSPAKAAVESSLAEAASKAPVMAATTFELEPMELKISAAVKQTLLDAGVEDFQNIKPTGKGGRITKADAMRYIEQQKAEEIPLVAKEAEINAMRNIEQQKAEESSDLLPGEIVEPPILAPENSNVSTSVFTTEQVETALRALYDSKGLQTCANLLREFEAAGIPELKEEDYAKFIDRAQLLATG